MQTIGGSSSRAREADEERKVMSLKPEPIGSIPQETACLAKPSVREGSLSSLHPSAGLDFVSQTVTLHTAFVLQERFAASVFSVVGSPPCGSMMKQVCLSSGKLWHSRRPPSCSTM